MFRRITRSIQVILSGLPIDGGTRARSPCAKCLAFSWSGEASPHLEDPGRSWKSNDHGFALCHYGAELTCDHEGRSNVHVPWNTLSHTPEFQKTCDPICRPLGSIRFKGLVSKKRLKGQSTSSYRGKSNNLLVNFDVFPVFPRFLRKLTPVNCVALVQNVVQQT